MLSAHFHADATTTGTKPPPAMARPSKRQLACRNANKVKMQKAKERRETGGLALGPSQSREDDDDDDDDDDTPPLDEDMEVEVEVEELQEEEESEGEASAKLAKTEEEDEETRLRESLAGVPVCVAPVPAPPPAAAAAATAPANPELYYPPSYGPLQQVMPPFRFVAAPYPAGPSTGYWVNGVPFPGLHYMAQPPPSPQLSGPLPLPPLPPPQSFPTPHQSYSPQQLPPQPRSQDYPPPPDSSTAPQAPKIIPEVSNYNYISGKPVCRQTLWRRKKRAEAAALNAAPAPPEPDPIRQHREELAEAIEKWPRVPTAKLKEEILDLAITDIEKLLKSKVRRPKGQDFNRYQQVLQFMNIQRMNRTNTPRMDLALIVANMYRKGREVADRIVRHEKEWIKRRVIPAGAQGKNAKIPSMLEDEGTIGCIRAHIDVMGEKLTAAGLAVAVSAYWQSEKAYEDNMMADAEENGEPPPDGEARKRKLTLSSRTASTWLGKLGYVFEDGVYRFKGVTPVIAPPQEGGAGGYVPVNSG